MALSPSPSRFWATHTQRIFTELSRENPDLFAGATPVALGSHGMVIDHQDGSVSKIFLRGSSQAGQEEKEKLYADEIKILQLMNGTTIGAAATPELIGKTEQLAGASAFASYRMTKLPGDEIKWDSFVNTATPGEIEHHFRSAGELLAHFHNSLPQLATVTPPEKGMSCGASVEAIPALDSKTNMALRICNEYLQANMQPGVNHGDFHSANFKVNKDYDITGLFDASFAGRTKNYLGDFAAIPEKGLPFAIDAYEKAGGKPIDRTMLAMTQVSKDVAMINWQLANPQRGPEALNNSLEDLRRHLNKVADVTGLAFDAPLSPGAAAGTTSPRILTAKVPGNRSG